MLSLCLRSPMHPLSRRTLLLLGIPCALAVAMAGVKAGKKGKLGDRRVARFEPRLSARVVSNRKLYYAEGPSPALDRPGHARAGSGLAWFGDRLALIQDDANFLALIDPKTGVVEAVTLAAGPGGKRIFDDTRGTKHLKLDLEACLAIRHPTYTEFFAFGSGSKAVRERILVARYDHFARSVTHQRVVGANSLYAGLTRARHFGGSELNLEGAVLQGAHLLLFQRGNGAVLNGHRPPNAVGKLLWSAFVPYIESGGLAPAPKLEHVTVYDLGATEGVPNTFTDATLGPNGTIVFLASAENSNSTVNDGEILGAYIGEIHPDGSARIGPFLDEHGKPLRAKAEGIALDAADPRKAWAVIDMDDPERPCELVELRLEFAP
jgi:hypothetical protein